MTFLSLKHSPSFLIAAVVLCIAGYSLVPAFCHPESVKELCKQGSEAMCQHQPKEAENFFERALIKAEKGEGSEDELIGCLNMLSFLYSNSGREDKALEYGNRMIQIFERKLGKDNLASSVIYTQMAIICDKQKNYSESEKLYFESIDMIQRLGEKVNTVPIDYTNLAALYKKQGRVKDACYMYECSVRGWEAIGQHEEALRTMRIYNDYRKQNGQPVSTFDLINHSTAPRPALTPVAKQPVSK